MKSAPCLISAALAALVALAPSPARAGDLQLDVGAGGLASTWRGDGGAFGSLKLGYRFLDLVAPYFLGRLGYAAVDQRMLTLVSLGGQLWGRVGAARPYLRVGLVHQHEEPLVAVSADAFGALFGVGDGIRHRAGFEGALGVDFPVWKRGAWTLKGLVEGMVTGYPDPRGPAIYGGGTAGLGFDYSL